MSFMKTTCKMITVEQIRVFLDERPLLTNRGVSKEAGLSDSYLGKVIRGDLKLTENSIEKLKPILSKYGFK